MKQENIHPTFRHLHAEDLRELDLEHREAACLECGLNEVESWSRKGPVAPALSPEILQRVSRRNAPVQWMGYGYKIAAALAILVLFVQLGNQNKPAPASDPQEASHFLVDSARNDTAFLLKDSPTEDTVKAARLFEEPIDDMTGQQTGDQPMSLVAVNVAGMRSIRVAGRSRSGKEVWREEPEEKSSEPWRQRLAGEDDGRREMMG